MKENYMEKDSKKPKYRIGDMVHSPQNKTVKRIINRINYSVKGSSKETSYKLQLKDIKGQKYSSNWIKESSISKYKKRG